ncbi:AAA family ATPase [bacterium]|jgi:cell division protease FtsH|nr:AAA family ATPase [bacterium]MBP9810477.1 AAA family ATPase [bacterium]
MKKPNLPKLPAWLKTMPKWLIMVGVFLVIFFIANLFSAGPNSEYDALQFAQKGDGIRSFDTALTLIKKDKGEIERITYGKDTWGNPVITIKRTGTTPMTAGLPPGEWPTVKALADEKHIVLDGTYQLPVKAKQGTLREAVWTIFIAWLPYLIMAAVMLFLFKKFNPMNSGKNKTPKHRLYPAGTVKDKLDQFAGNDEAKEESVEIIEFLQNPTALAKHGGVVPRGALMVGEPGNGKTLLARCIAGEAGVSFITISGSDFVEMFVGMGAKAVRDLFEDAKKLAPCIIFIDEIDAVGRQRGTGMGGGNDEREQTLNELLVQLDGFERMPGVYVIAATNRADVLDKALLRPGRLTKTITVEAPDLHARKLILAVHRKGKTFAKDVDFDHIANSTWSFSGADIAELMNRSVILMLRRVAAAKKLGKKLAEEINSADIEDAIIEGTMKALASKSSSRRQDPSVKRMLAYHEGGHGLVTEAGYQRWLASGKHWAHQWGNALRRLTIVGAAGTGGHMQATPDSTSPVQTEEALLGRIASAVGATIAERMYTGTASTGNSNDLKQAYNIAKMMVTKFGMSDLGGISVGADQENPNLGRQMGMGSGAYGLSNESSNQIDQEILSKLATGCRMAIRALLEREEFLHALADLLVVKETIARAEWLELWNKYTPAYVSDAQVEAELKKLWPRFERLSVRRA